MVNMYTQNFVERIKLKASSIFRSRVGLGYGRFLFSRNEVGVSFDTYMKLAKIENYDDLPFEKIKIKIKAGTDTEKLGNSLRL